jgi:hypothetical protein
MHFENVVPRDGTDNERWGIFRLDLIAFSNLMKQHRPDRWLIDPKERLRGDYKHSRYEYYQALYAENKPFTMPEITHNGVLPDIGDGRHRLYVLIDKGYTSINACCSASDLEKLRNSVGC